MKSIKYIGATLALVALVLGAVVPTATVGATVVEDDNKVTICHRTNSVKNPYVKITVDESAVDGEGQNDHTQHTGPIATSEAVAQALKDNKQKWGDIIPDAAHGGVGAGLNWSYTGYKIFKNNCGNYQSEPEAVVPAAVTFTPPTCATLGSYTIPAAENVDYLVDGDVVDPGTYTAQNSTTVTVTAEAHEEFYVEDGTTDTWTNTFSAPTGCGGQVLGTQVSVTPTGAVGAGGGGGASATGTVVGLVASLATLAFGLVVRRRLV